MAENLIAINSFDITYNLLIWLFYWVQLHFGYEIPKNEVSKSKFEMTITLLIFSLVYYKTWTPRNCNIRIEYTKKKIAGYFVSLVLVSHNYHHKIEVSHLFIHTFTSSTNQNSPKIM